MWGWGHQKQTKELSEAGSDKQSSLSPEEMVILLFGLWYPLQPQCNGKCPLFFVHSGSELKRKKKTPEDWAIKSAWLGYLMSVTLKRQRENSPLSIHDNPSKSYLWMDYSEGHPSLIKLNLWTVRNCLRKNYSTQYQPSVGRGPGVTT